MNTEFYQRARACRFCIDQTKDIDYKDSRNLKRFLSPYGKIMAASRTGVCAKHQRTLTQSIKRARFMALLPYEMR